MRVAVPSTGPKSPKPSSAAPAGGMDSERWLAAIVESSDDAILGESLDGTITSWNRGAMRIFGYEASEAIGQHISFLAWPGEEEQVETFLDKLRHGERVDHFEVARKHKSGRKIFVSISLSPVLDGSGKIIGIAKIARHIPDHGAVVERVAAEVLRLRDLAEAEVLRLRDLDEAEVLRLRDLDEVAVLRKRNLAEAEVLRLRDLDEVAVLRLRDLDEAEVLRLRDLAEAEVLRLRDVFEQQAASAIALIAERRFRELIESAPDAILQMGPSGTIILANRRATQMFGYTLEELLAHGMEGLVPGADPIHPSHHFTGEDPHGRRKDGTRFPVELSMSPMRTEEGVDVTAIIRDISERRQIEERVRFLQQQELDERDARNKLAEHEIQVRQEYMTTLSHELRTPLHTIIGFAELLAEESHGRLNPKQQKYLNHIQHDSEHFLVLINDMLDLGRMEAGGFNLNLESLSVRDAVSEAVEAIRPFAASRSVSVREGSHLDHSVLADPTRLRQILYNLLSNGAKFTGAGGEVWVDAAWDGNLVTITVSDNGVGITPGNCARIFDKFYQAGITPAGELEGSGLGLSITRQLVELQGGTIWVESEPHKGSRFHFTLPASSELVVAGLPESQSEERS